MSAPDRPEQSNLGFHPGLQRGDAASQLRAQLVRARSLYQDGAFDEAARLLGELPGGPAINGGAVDVAHTRVLASAAAVAGRALWQLGRDADARDRSNLAVSLFESWMHSEPVEAPGGDELSDYGIALYIVGGRDVEARDHLERAVAAGVREAETYRVLGLTRMRLEQFGPAAEALFEAVTRQPGHIPTLEALVRCLDAQSADPALRAAAYLELAGAYFTAGRLDDARGACTTSVELHETSRGLAGLGIILGMQGELDRAIGFFDRALALDPKDTDALFRKGEALRLLERVDESIDVLKRVPEGAEQHVLALGSLGAALKAAGRHDEALQTFDEALERNPNYAFALAGKADLLLALKRDDDAIAFYRRAMAAPGATVWPAFQLAELLRMRGQYDESLETIEAVLEREPDNVPALGTKGGALYGRGQPAEALLVLDRALDRQPKYAFGLAMKGQALIKLGRRDEAVTALRRSLEIDASQTQVRFDLAESLRLLERYDEALAELDTLLGTQPDSGLVLGTKGQVLASLSRHEEAVQILERAVSLDPKLDWAWFALGESQRLLNRYEAALASFDRVLELIPDTEAGRHFRVRTLGWKGDVLLSLQRYDEAIAVLDRAIDLDPRHAFSIATKGQVRAAQGRRDEGVELLTQAVAIDREQAARPGRSFTLTWALFDLAENLRVLNRFDEAVAVYDELLQLQPTRADALGGKGAALFAQEKYDAALEILDRALAVSAGYAFGLSIKGALLTSCGEYQAAADLLARAIALDDTYQYPLMVQGFTLRVLGRTAEAETTLGRAIELDPEDLTARHNLGDLYRTTGRAAEARKIYEAIVGRPAADLDPDTAAIVGWCHFGLGNYDRAVDALVDAVARGRMMAHAQFDLALALLCSGRGELAEREYERGIEMAVADHHPWRRRGLYRLALLDIASARTLLPEAFANLPHAPAIERRLQSELDRTPPFGAPAATPANVTA
jgi:tetratricopeptide (TPR) repeat protein